LAAGPRRPKVPWVRPVAVVALLVSCGFASRRLQGAVKGLAATVGRTAPATHSAPVAWLRRVCLDLVGDVPDRVLLEEFRRDSSKAARSRVVDRLLSRPGFARRWARLLARPLFATGSPNPAYRKHVEDYLADGLARRKGYNSLVRGMLMAEGIPSENPAVGFLMQFTEDKTEVASRVGSAFLGVRIACAQCHDHPFAPWKMGDYYGLSAWFSRVRLVAVPRDIYKAYRAGRQGQYAEVDIMLPRGKGQQLGEKSLKRIATNLGILNRHALSLPPARNRTMTVARTEAPASTPMMKAADLSEDVYVLVEDGTAELDREEIASRIPSTSPRMGQLPRSLPPRILSGGPVIPARASRREQFADWMTDPKNPYFVRTLVNRIWANLFGRGLVEPLDDVLGRADAPTARVLAALAHGLVSHRFDIASYLKVMVMSDYYQMNWIQTPPVRPYRWAPVRPLDPEQVARSLQTALGIDNGGPLEDALAKHYETRPSDEEGEVALSPVDADLERALFLLNGAQLHQALQKAPVLSRLAGKSAPACLTELFEALLCRPPTAAERARLEPELGTPARTEALADVTWALCVSTEFLSNH
jgi:hypothetical protein